MNEIKAIVARVFLDFDESFTASQAYDIYMLKGETQNVRLNTFLNTKDFDVVTDEMRGLFDDIHSFNHRCS